MITRSDILGEAVNKCMKELYLYARPHVEWEDFINQNKLYSSRYNIWKKTNETDPNYIGKSITECLGPRPYEFYYLPKDILKDIIDNYVYVYRIDEHQDLLDTIEVLKNYCKKPIVDKWIEGENGFPGHRGYDHPDNLKEEIKKILGDIAIDNDYYQDAICNKFFEFLDMAGNFYNWNSELNSFYQSVYLGCSPNSSKDIVIENWKKYKGEDIEINEEEIKKEYYGEEELD